MVSNPFHVNIYVLLGDFPVVPFGPEYGDTVITSEEDGVLFRLFPLPVVFPFFGRDQTVITVGKVTYSIIFHPSFLKLIIMSSVASYCSSLKG